MANDPLQDFITAQLGGTENYNPMLQPKRPELPPDYQMYRGSEVTDSPPLGLREGYDNGKPFL